VDVTGPFVLARDVALIEGPVVGAGRLAPAAGGGCDVAFIGDVATVRMIARFRSPTTICDAIWATASEMSRHPEDVLDDCYPAIRRLIVDGYIVAADSALARPGTTPALRTGAGAVG
jgi:hypothetical protein